MYEKLMYTRVNKEIKSKVFEIKVRKIAKVKFFTTNHLNIERGLHCSPACIGDSLEIIT